ncbi:MobA/MobL family protein [Escherichia coli]|uniref:MobA/MobL family protein n=1 Tax=Escherichia coli TaxID=562 RepID=UPI0010ACFF4A|nr:MobA/MobL family protein [Escherichia coli]EAS0404615.1 MobA/MobL family protein [Salmonella enterica]EBR0250871.1 MobA/MobL family protein [Salmonella enterica subsp. enterica serovar Corvallis]EEA4042655.1 MobA/MobL family protein [Salmonella enterica subsp. enterica serovar Heidelberg]EED3224446.1 MobA/MobL family protein [Salmonella enterica subsp. enterica serovar Typhimurium]EAZ3742523.1 MobA/MobL family protein [Salmonella enterica]
MASYHCTVKTGAKGSALKHADYISRTGEYENYKSREDLEFSSSGNMPSWAKKNPSELWKAADEFERKNGTAYREIEIALPRELTREQRIELVEDFVQKELGDRHAYQYAIHNPPGAIDGKEQPHAHIMFCERINDGIERDPQQFFKRANSKLPERGGAKKARFGETQQERKSALVELRSRWADVQNEHLARHGHESRVDHRSLKEQGINRTPEVHLGPVQAASLNGEQIVAIQERRNAERELKTARDAANAIQPEQEQKQKIKAVEPVRSARLMDEYRDVARKVITLETRQNESQELALKHHLFMKAEAKEQELAKLKEQLKKMDEQRSVYKNKVDEKKQNITALVEQKKSLERSFIGLFKGGMKRELEEQIKTQVSQLEKTEHEVKQLDENYQQLQMQADNEQKNFSHSPEYQYSEAVLSGIPRSILKLQFALLPSESTIAFNKNVLDVEQRKEAAIAAELCLSEDERRQIRREIQDVLNGDACEGQQTETLQQKRPEKDAHIEWEREESPQVVIPKTYVFFSACRGVKTEIRPFESCDDAIEWGLVECELHDRFKRDLIVYRVDAELIGKGDDTVMKNAERIDLTDELEGWNQQTHIEKESLFERVQQRSQDDELEM